jgi:hypothetical protein
VKNDVEYLCHPVTNGINSSSKWCIYSAQNTLCRHKTHTLRQQKPLYAQHSRGHHHIAARVTHIHSRFLRRASTEFALRCSHQFSNSFRRFHHQLNRAKQGAKTVGTRAVCLGPNSIHKRRRVSIFQLTSSSAHLVYVNPPSMKTSPGCKTPHPNTVSVCIFYPACYLIS